MPKNVFLGNIFRKINGVLINKKIFSSWRRIYYSFFWSKITIYYKLLSFLHVVAIRFIVGFPRVFPKTASSSLSFFFFFFFYFPSPTWPPIAANPKFPNSWPPNPSPPLLLRSLSRCSAPWSGFIALAWPLDPSAAFSDETARFPFGIPSVRFLNESIGGVRLIRFDSPSFSPGRAQYAMPPFLSTSRALRSSLSRGDGVGRLIKSRWTDSRRPGLDRTRCLGGIAGLDASFGRNNKASDAPKDVPIGSGRPCGGGIMQRRRFLGCGDGEEGGILAKVYEEKRVLG